MESKAKSPGNMSMVHCRDWAKQQYLSTEQIHKVKISDLQTSTPMSPLVLLTPGLGLLSSGKSAYKNLHSCGARGLVIVWLKFAKNKFKNSQKTRFSTINGRSRYLYAGDEKLMKNHYHHYYLSRFRFHVHVHVILQLISISDSRALVCRFGARSKHIISWFHSYTLCNMSI